MIREIVLLFAVFVIFKNGIAAPVEEPINQNASNQEKIKEEPKVSTNSTTNVEGDSGYVNIQLSVLMK
jgi:hypothetical protein